MNKREIDVSDLLNFKVNINYSKLADVLKDKFLSLKENTNDISSLRTTITQLKEDRLVLESLKDEFDDHKPMVEVLVYFIHRKNLKNMMTNLPK